MKFVAFRDVVLKTFNRITAENSEEGAGGWYVVNTSKDDIYAAYQNAFPEGTNEIFRVRATHDCNCCKRFITRIGRVIAVSETGTVSTVWEDAASDYGLAPEYREVAATLDSLVRAAGISSAFVVDNMKEFYDVGQAQNNEVTESGTLTWHHFHAQVPKHLRARHSSAAKVLGDRAENMAMLKSTLNHVPAEVTQTLIEYIQQDSIYRGKEHLETLTSLHKMQKTWAGIGARARSRFLWVSAHRNPGACRLRSSLIGTLLQDMAADSDYETAVKKYEKAAAPENYKRPTALVTEAQRNAARDAVKSLGYTTMLYRRIATLFDFPPEQMLFLNRAPYVAPDVVDDAFGNIAVAAKKAPKAAKEISWDDFRDNVLPTAAQLELFYTNDMRNNRVAFTSGDTPADYFAWKHPLAWSYAGNYTDAIRERVKNAGGAVEGDVCIRLAWDYTDDLDLSVKEPDGYTVYYRNRKIASGNGGTLDVDANGMDGIRPDPCENIVYPNRIAMQPGEYEVRVNNYTRRSDGVGFKMHIEICGVTHEIEYDKPLRSDEWVSVAKLTVGSEHNVTVEFGKAIQSAVRPKRLWGIDTHQFHNVQLVFNSPNYWVDKPRGLQHTFFVLSGATPDEPVRAFFNEYLTPELHEHRKTLEIVGATTQLQPGSNATAGVGFVTDSKRSALLRVSSGYTQHIYNVTF